MHDWACEKGCRDGNMQNHTGSTFWPNNKYWNRSCAKIVKGALPKRAGILACVIGHAKKVALSESREIARVAYFGKITNIGSGPARKI